MKSVSRTYRFFDDIAALTCFTDTGTEALNATVRIVGTQTKISINAFVTMDSFNVQLQNTPKRKASTKWMKTKIEFFTQKKKWREKIENLLCTGNGFHIHRLASCLEYRMHISCNHFRCSRAHIHHIFVRWNPRDIHKHHHPMNKHPTIQLDCNRIVCTVFQHQHQRHTDDNSFQYIAHNLFPLWMPYNWDTRRHHCKLRTYLNSNVADRLLDCNSIRLNVRCTGKVSGKMVDGKIIDFIWNTSKSRVKTVHTSHFSHSLASAAVADLYGRWLNNGQHFSQFEPHVLCAQLHSIKFSLLKFFASFACPLQSRRAPILMWRNA